MKIPIDEPGNRIFWPNDMHCSPLPTIFQNKDTLAQSGEEVSIFLGWMQSLFKGCLDWFNWFFCCSETVETKFPKEKSKVELQLEKVQELIDSFLTQSKGETFRIWWKKIFSELDEEVQQMIFEEDQVERGYKENKESIFFIVELQNMLDLNGRTVISAKDKIPGYLQKVKKKLEEQS